MLQKVVDINVVVACFCVNFDDAGWPNGCQCRCQNAFKRTILLYERLLLHQLHHQTTSAINQAIDVHLVNDHTPCNQRTDCQHQHHFYRNGNDDLQ